MTVLTIEHQIPGVEVVSAPQAPLANPRTGNIEPPDHMPIPAGAIPPIPRPNVPAGPTFPNPATRIPAPSGANTMPTN